jgi:hypothetical protein
MISHAKQFLPKSSSFLKIPQKSNMASSFARGFLGTLRKSNGNKLVTYDEDMVFLGIS